MTSSPDQLPTDTIPLPFSLPVTGIAQCGDLLFQGIGQVKRIGPRNIAAGPFFAQQVGKTGGRWIPVAADTVRNDGGAHSDGLRQSIHDHFLGDADPETAGDEFVKNQAFLPSQALPATKDITLLNLF